MKRNIFCAVILIMAVSPLFNVPLAQESVRRILRNGSNTNIVTVPQKGGALPLSTKPSRPDAGRPVQTGKLSGGTGSVLPLAWLKKRIVSEEEFKSSYQPHGWKHNPDGTLEAPPGWPVDMWLHKPIEPRWAKWNIMSGDLVSYLSEDSPEDYGINRTIHFDVQKPPPQSTLFYFQEETPLRSP